MSAGTEAYSSPLRRPNSRFTGNASLNSPLSPWYTDTPRQFRPPSSPLSPSQQRSAAIFVHLDELTPRHPSPVFAARSARVVSGGGMSPRCAILAYRRYQVRPGDDGAYLQQSQRAVTRGGRAFASTICRGSLLGSPRIVEPRSIPNTPVDVTLPNRPLTARQPSFLPEQQHYQRQRSMKQAASTQNFRGIRRDDDSLMTSSNDLSNTDEGFSSYAKIASQEHPSLMSMNTIANPMVGTKQRANSPDHRQVVAEAIPRQFVQRFAVPSKRRAQAPEFGTPVRNSHSLERNRIESSQRVRLSGTLNREFPIHESLCVPPHRNAAATPTTAASNMYSSMGSTVMHQHQHQHQQYNGEHAFKMSPPSTAAASTAAAGAASAVVVVPPTAAETLLTTETTTCITRSNSIDESRGSADTRTDSQPLVTKASFYPEVGVSYALSRSLLRQLVQRWRNQYEENKAAYSEGGYMTITPGKKLNSRYVVVQKLGWGEFSTVWLAYDTMHTTLGKPHQAFVALKIAKCDAMVSQSTHYEINLLRYVGMRASENIPLTNLIDSFEVNGHYGSHVCMVMPLHGSNLLSIIDQMKVKKGMRSASEIRLIKEVVTSTLVGLRELDKIDVIHTDIKPENILCFSPDPKVLDVIETFCQRNRERSTMVPYEKVRDAMLCGDPKHLVCVADFGLSVALRPSTTEALDGGKCRSLLDGLLGSKKEFPVEKAGVVTNLRGTMIQTREYRAPEIIIGLDFNTRTDLWSLGCMVYELITGHFLVDPKRRTRNERMMDVEHLAMIMQLLGPVPEEIVALREGRGSMLPPPRYIHRYFDEKHRFIYAEKYRFYPRRHLDKELEHYLPPAEAKGAAAFIMQCLASYDPMKRPSAHDVFCHAWLSDVTGKQ